MCSLAQGHFREVGVEAGGYFLPPPSSPSFQYGGTTKVIDSDSGKPNPFIFGLSHLLSLNLVFVQNVCVHINLLSLLVTALVPSTLHPVCEGQRSTHS